MSKMGLGLYMKGYSSRCVCCNKVLSDRTYSTNKVTGEMDPLCSYCRTAINSTNINFDKDKQELEQSVWREPLGSINLQDMPNVELEYQGYN